MTERVDPAEVERIVGCARRQDEHVARAVSAELRVYLLHSHACLAEHEDLRACPFSLAVEEHGINRFDWQGWEDETVYVEVGTDGCLYPLGRVRSHG